MRNKVLCLLALAFMMGVGSSAVMADTYAVYGVVTGECESGYKITITRVDVTDDLRLARIYFCVPKGDERGRDALAGFKSAMGYLRRTLSHRLGLRYMPELRFIYDDSFDRADSINRVLKAIHNENHSTFGNSPKT